MTALSGFMEFFHKGKTFRSRKEFARGTLRYSLHKQAQASLNSGINLRAAVKLPPGEDLNDWIAVHGTCIDLCRKFLQQQGDWRSIIFTTNNIIPVVDFFNRINLIYGIVSEYCDSASCPTMSGGARFEYLWADGEKYKKPTALPAPQYVSLLMDWIEAQINNETIFPVLTDIPFPKTYVPLCRKILTRLFRVFVHVYIHHFDRVVAIGSEAHVNTCYKQFYYFVTEFELINSKELEPLAEMTAKVCKDTVSPTQSTAPSSTAR